MKKFILFLKLGWQFGYRNIWRMEKERRRAEKDALHGMKPPQ